MSFPTGNLEVLPTRIFKKLRIQDGLFIILFG